METTEAAPAEPIHVEATVVSTETDHAADAAEAAAKSVAADALIQNKVLWALGAGLIPFPLFDLAAIVGVQVKLLNDLSEHYGRKFSEERAKKLVGVLVASVGTRVLLTGAAASVLKIFPGVGTIAGDVAVPAVAAASTYALGQVFKHHFEQGGSVFDFEQAKAKEYYKKAYSEGEKVVAKLKASLKPKAS